MPWVVRLQENLTSLSDSHPSRADAVYTSHRGKDASAPAALSGACLPVITQNSIQLHSAPIKRNGSRFLYMGVQ